MSGFKPSNKKNTKKINIFTKLKDTNQKKQDIINKLLKK